MVQNPTIDTYLIFVYFCWFISHFIVGFQLYIHIWKLVCMAKFAYFFWAVNYVRVTCFYVDLLYPYPFLVLSIPFLNVHNPLFPSVWWWMSGQRNPDKTLRFSTDHRHPRPFSMQPFLMQLKLVSHTRCQWWHCISATFPAGLGGMRLPGYLLGPCTGRCLRTSSHERPGAVQKLSGQRMECLAIILYWLHRWWLGSSSWLCVWLTRAFCFQPVCSFCRLLVSMWWTQQ